MIENDFRLQSEKYILSILLLSNIHFFKFDNINKKLGDINEKNKFNKNWKKYSKNKKK